MVIIECGFVPVMWSLLRADLKLRFMLLAECVQATIKNVRKTTTILPSQLSVYSGLLSLLYVCSIKEKITIIASCEIAVIILRALAPSWLSCQPENDHCVKPHTLEILLLRRYAYLFLQQNI